MQYSSLSRWKPKAQADAESSTHQRPTSFIDPIDVYSSSITNVGSIAMSRISLRSTALLKPTSSQCRSSQWRFPHDRGQAACLHSSPRRASTTLPNYPQKHQTTHSSLKTANFLDNQLVSSKTSSWIDLHDPATNKLVTRVPQSTDDELRAAVESATKAFPRWRATSLLQRQQFMFRFVALIRANWDRLAAAITLEQGKTFADAKGDVLRGLQVAETACGITTQLTGEVLEVSTDMETRSYREPLGVVAAICPFSEMSILSLYCVCSAIVQRIWLSCSERFPGHDPTMDDPNRDGHGQLYDPEAVRA